MKTSLDHLPAPKRDQITAIAEHVKSSELVEMILLFGSYARGDWVEDRDTGYFSDFDLMVIVATPAEVENHALWSSVSAHAKAIAGHVPVTIVVHDIKQVNQEIRSGQYFFIDILREGVMLYTSRRHNLAHPKALGPAARLKLGRINFRYWFSSASEFWRGAGYYAARGLGAHAAFLLHQSVERYFHAVLLVFTGYKPKTHDIELLANQTAPLHEALVGAMPRVEAEDKRLFQLLKRAYIEARYSKSYRVTAEELSTLRAQVLDLAARVREACAEKLASFCGPEAVGELPEVPSATDVGELPEAPPLDDEKALEAWREALVSMSYERGQRQGEARGRQEGRQEERARAIVDVLRRRGVALSDAEVDRILACRDEAALTRWWDQAWSAASAAELLGE